MSGTEPPYEKPCNEDEFVSHISIAQILTTRSQPSMTSSWPRSYSGGLSRVLLSKRAHLGGEVDKLYNNTSIFVQQKENKIGEEKTQRHGTVHTAES